MTHITLSIPEELYKAMKKHREIKWSEVAREAIRTKLSKMSSASPPSEILEMLSKEARQELEAMPTEKAKRLAREAVKHRWKRTKSLIQTS
jgi:hypothetical protein